MRHPISVVRPVPVQTCQATVLAIAVAVAVTVAAGAVGAQSPAGDANPAGNGAPASDSGPAGDASPADNTAPANNPGSADAPTAEAPPSGEDPLADDLPKQREGYQGPDKDQVFFEAYWDHGVKYRLLGGLEFEDGEYFTVPHLVRRPVLVGEIGLNLQVDAAAYTGAAATSDVDDKVEVRRSFITARGTFFNFLYPIDFSIEMGAITQKFFVNEGFVQLNELPYVGSLKLGQYTAPMSLDSLNSSRDNPLMERASPVQAFSAGTLAGAKFFDYSREKRTTWAIGVFADGQNGEVGDASDSLARVVGRLSWVPLVYETPGEPALLHLGIAGSYLVTSDDFVRYQSRPESFLSPIAIDTGDIDARNAFVLGTEVAFASGSISGQFEYLHAFAGGGDAGSVDFPGLYLQLNGFLTGENRPYDYARGAFGQVIPRRPVSYANGTWGALEWAARYSYTSLDSGPVRGGKMHTLTAGWNWYWNRYVRWQFDYGLSLVDDGTLDGTLHVFQMRMQIAA